MIDTIILDIGNVMVSFDWRSYLESYHFTPKATEAVAKATFLSRNWQEVDRGLMAKELIRRRLLLQRPIMKKRLLWFLKTIHPCSKNCPMRCRG